MVESNADVAEFVAQLTPAISKRDAESIIDESYRTATAGIFGHRACESSGGRPTA